MAIAGASRYQAKFLADCDDAPLADLGLGPFAGVSPIRL
jgi:hypothetical protein